MDIGDVSTQAFIHPFLEKKRIPVRPVAKNPWIDLLCTYDWWLTAAIFPTVPFYRSSMLWLPRSPSRSPSMSLLRNSRSMWKGSWGEYALGLECACNSSLLSILSFCCRGCVVILPRVPYWCLGAWCSILRWISWCYLFVFKLPFVDELYNNTAWIGTRLWTVAGHTARLPLSLLCIGTSVIDRFPQRRRSKCLEWLGVFRRRMQMLLTAVAEYIAFEYKCL